MSPVERTEKLARSMAAARIERHRVWVCDHCQAQNRVDTARIVATGERARCGRCHRALLQRATDVEEFLIAMCRLVWSDVPPDPGTMN